MVHLIFDVIDQVIGNIRTLDIAFDVFPEVFFLSKERGTFGINIHPLQQLLLVIAAQLIVEIHGDLLSQILIIAHAAIVLKFAVLLHLLGITLPLHCPYSGNLYNPFSERRSLVFLLACCGL